MIDEWKDPDVVVRTASAVVPQEIVQSIVFHKVADSALWTAVLLPSSFSR